MTSEWQYNIPYKTQTTNEMNMQYCAAMVATQNMCTMVTCLILGDVPLLLMEEFGRSGLV